MSAHPHPLPPSAAHLPPALMSLLARPADNPAHKSVEQWQGLMQQAPLDKATLHSLVINWLLVEGYQSAAEQFQQEANVKGSVPLASISARTSVRAALSQGRVEEAQREIDALLPTLLESNPALRLQLHQQQLVELIRSDRVEDALSYARSHLRACSAHDPASLHALEGIMSLLAFSALPPGQNPMAHLLEQRARVSLAGAVNDAILEGQFACKESALQRCVKQTIHAQKQLANVLTSFPQLPLDSGAEGAATAAPATAATASSSTSSAPIPAPFAPSSLPTPAGFLDPAGVLDHLAQREADARRAVEEAAAAEFTQVMAALEQERRMRIEQQQDRRQRRAAAARAAEPRSAARRGISRRPQVQAGEEDEDDEEEREAEEQRLRALAAEAEEEAQMEGSDEEEEEEEEDEESDEEDQHMGVGQAGFS